MSYTYFEPEGSSSGRRLYVQARYGTVRHGMVRHGTVRYGSIRYGMVRYGTVRYGTAQYGTVRVTHCSAYRLLVLVHVQSTVPQVYIEMSSWKWTLGFETCRRHKKLKIKILIYETCIFCLYCIIVLQGTEQWKSILSHGTVIQSCSVYVYLYIHTVMNISILQLVAIYNIQLHV